VLLFVRNYGEGDNVVLHFHGEPNEPALRARIREFRRAPETQK
jgi:hypothetical protein